ncbi:MAG TPA: OmpA family protein [Actinomycetales bacterium]|nr:OmpA family protein [Actinomycetales bacterium]
MSRSPHVVGARSVASISVGALLLGLVGALPAQAEELADPLEKGQPTDSEIAASIHDLEAEDSVRDLELRVADVDVESSISSLERDDDKPDLITLDTDILFAFGSAELSDAAKSALRDIAKELATAKGEVKVVGHTDSVGSDAANQKLSEARAKAVAQQLREGLGASGPKMVATGKGESEPVAPNSKDGEDNPEGRAKNRRVEIRS